MKPANKQFSEELGLTFILVLLLGVFLKLFGLIPFTWYGIFIFSISAVSVGTITVILWVSLIVASRFIIDKWKESKLIKKVKKKFKRF